MPSTNTYINNKVERVERTKWIHLALGTLLVRIYNAAKTGETNVMALLPVEI